MITTAQEKEKYIPGTCNIGKQELQYRRWANYAAGIAVLVVVVLLQVYRVSHPWRWILFPVLAGFLVNTQQVYFHFCVRFGVAGVFNFDKVGHTHSVEQKEFARLDRMKAWRMIISSIIIALVLTVLYYFLPV